MDNDIGMQAQSSTGSAGLRTEARIMPLEPNVMRGVRTDNGDRKWETGYSVRLRHLVEDLHANKYPLCVGTVLGTGDSQ